MVLPTDGEAYKDKGGDRSQHNNNQNIGQNQALYDLSQNIVRIGLGRQPSPADDQARCKNPNARCAFLDEEVSSKEGAFRPSSCLLLRGFDNIRDHG